jgi:hypothetical protein
VICCAARLAILRAQNLLAVTFNGYHLLNALGPKNQAI